MIYQLSERSVGLVIEVIYTPVTNRFIHKFIDLYTAAYCIVMNKEISLLHCCLELLRNTVQIKSSTHFLLNTFNCYILLVALT